MIDGPFQVNYLPCHLNRKPTVFANKNLKADLFYMQKDGLSKFRLTEKGKKYKSTKQINLEQ